jgi:hypothetical protein
MPLARTVCSNAFDAALTALGAGITSVVEVSWGAGEQPAIKIAASRLHKID